MKTNQQSMTTKLSLEDVEPQDTEKGLDRLLANDAIQNSLLQNYRQTDIYLQTLLLAVAGGVVAILASFSKGKLAIYFVIPLALMSGWITFRFQSIVRGRAETVSHIHRRIVLAEQRLPPEQRSVTLQKLFQQRAEISTSLASILRSNSIVDPVQLRQAASDLVKGGFSHTRNLIGKLIIISFCAGWLALVFVAAVFL